MGQVTNPNTNRNTQDVTLAMGVDTQKEKRMELAAKAYLLFLTLVLLATTINNAAELDTQQRWYALVGTALAVLAVLVVW